MSYTISGGLSDVDLVVSPIDILTISGDLSFITISSFIDYSDTISGLITIITSTGEEEDYYYNSWITNSWNKFTSMYVLGTIDTSGGDIYIRQGSMYVGQTFNGIPVQLIRDNIYNSIYTTYYDSTTLSGEIISLSSNLLPTYIESLNNTMMNYNTSLSGIVYGNYQLDNSKINTLIDTNDYLFNYNTSLSGIVYGNYQLDNSKINTLIDTDNYLFNYNTSLSGIIYGNYQLDNANINTLIDTDNYLQNYSNTLSGIVYGNYQLDNANINTLIDTDNYLQNYSNTLSGVVYTNYHKLGDRIQALDDFNILDMTSTQQYLFNYSNTLSGVVYGNYHKLGDRIQALDDFNILDMTSTQQYLFDYSNTLSGIVYGNYQSDNSNMNLIDGRLETVEADITAISYNSTSTLTTIADTTRLNTLLFPGSDERFKLSSDGIMYLRYYTKDGHVFYSNANTTAVEMCHMHVSNFHIKIPVKFYEDITCNNTTITITQLGYVSGATSNIQDQITTLDGRIDDLEQITTDITYSSGTTTFSEDVKITSTQNSTSITSGCLTLEGGLGMKDNLCVGGYFRVGSSLESTSTTTGAVWIQGGTGIMKNLNVGGTTTLNDELIIATSAFDTTYQIKFENEDLYCEGSIQYTTTNGYLVGDRMKIGNKSLGRDDPSATYIFIKNPSNSQIVSDGLYTGWIGINKENPSFQLDISGTCNIDGELTCPTITTLQNKCNYISQSGGYTTINGVVNISSLNMTRRISNTPHFWVSGNTTAMDVCYSMVFTNGYDVYIPDSEVDGTMVTVKNISSSSSVKVRLSNTSSNLIQLANSSTSTWYTALSSYGKTKLVYSSSMGKWYVLY